MTRLEYMQCPYCKRKYINNGVKNKGKFVVKQKGDIVLIFQCMRCTGVFRIRMMGCPLLWDDLSSEEKLAFRYHGWRDIDEDKNSGHSGTGSTSINEYEKP